MAPLQLADRTLTVSRGYTYTYYVASAQEGKPVVLLLHGWPDSAQLWANLINNYLLPHGYGVVALDCLGYAGTSKPTDPKEYAFKDMTADLAEILDAEQVEQVIAMGHDWGSGFAQRFYNFFPSRVVGVVLVNGAYNPPSTDPFDLQAVNPAVEKACGLGLYEYWTLFAAADGAAIMNQNLESVYTVAFADPKTWVDNWCTPNGMRKYVSEGRTQPTLAFADAEHHKDFMERLGRDGMDGPQCWYRSHTTGVEAESNKALEGKDPKIDVPVFFWGASGDVVCNPELLQSNIEAGLLPHVKSVNREGGHWALLENPKVFGEDVLQWLNKTYAKARK
jgi:soluble epoxide hydrolase / lipid-phosphate phosphatase